MKALRGTSVLGAVLLAAAAGFVTKAGASPPRAPEEGPGAVEGAPVEPGVFEGDVHDLPHPPPWKQGDPIREVPRRVHPRPRPPVSPETPPPDPLFTPQSRGGDGRSIRVFNPPDLVFGGVGFTGAFPPDPVGDVGPNHYIQMVNSGGGSRVRIFDKSGGRLADFDLDSLAPAGSGVCANGSEDPIVLFDGLANRWLLSEITPRRKPPRNNHLCVYISRTPDPISGGFFVYDFEVPRFPDYPKYAVWPDAYYVSTNERRPTAYALQRRRMRQRLPFGQPVVHVHAPILRHAARHLVLELAHEGDRELVVAVAQREELGAVAVFRRRKLGHRVGSGDVGLVAAGVLHELVAFVAEHAIHQVPEPEFPERLAKSLDFH